MCQNMLLTSMWILGELFIIIFTIFIISVLFIVMICFGVVIIIIIIVSIINTIIIEISIMTLTFASVIMVDGSISFIIVKIIVSSKFLYLQPSFIATVDDLLLLMMLGLIIYKGMYTYRPNTHTMTTVSKI